MPGWWAARDDAWALAKAYALLDRTARAAERQFARRPWLAEAARGRHYPEVDRATYRLTRDWRRFAFEFGWVSPAGAMKILPGVTIVVVSRITGRAVYGFVL